MGARRSIFLPTLFALQSLCALYFLWDIAVDAFPEALPVIGENDLIEGAITLALFLSLAFTGSELRKLLTRNKRMTDQLEVASGAFSKLLDTQFNAWALSPSERDVALLAIKGCSIAEMARLRETREGTVKAQCAAVYRKAGVSGRLQLLSYFIEELMSEQLVARPAERQAH